MGRRRADIPAEQGDDQRAFLDARWWLCSMAAFVHHCDSPAAFALAELKARHALEPRRVLDAYREAVAVLGSAGLAEWDAWKARSGGGGTWPTVERQRDVERFHRQMRDLEAKGAV